MNGAGKIPLCGRLHRLRKCKGVGAPLHCRSFVFWGYYNISGTLCQAVFCKTLYSFFFTLHICMVLPFFGNYVILTSVFNILGGDVLICLQKKR